MNVRLCIFAAGLTFPAAAFSQTVMPGYPGAHVNKSQVVPQVATDIFPQSTNGNINLGLRVRLILRDTAIDSGSSAAVTIWCAKGTAASSPAVIGANGFPLNAGIDDTGNGVEQGGINCIQAAGQTHYAQMEQY